MDLQSGFQSLGESLRPFRWRRLLHPRQHQCVVKPDGPERINIRPRGPSTGPLSDQRVLTGLVAMTAVALLAALWATRTINPLRGDTFEYFYFDPSRTVGYPAFLAMVRVITGNVALAVPAQMALLALSLLLLGWSFHKLVGRPALSFTFQAMVLIQVAVWKASAFFMTEGLSTALIAIWCAQLLRMVRAPDLRGAAHLAAIAGAATMVRPSLVALFFGTAIFIAAAMSARERGRGLIITAAGLALAWAATPVAQLLVHGSAKTTSPLARGVLQHTLYCNPGRAPNDEDSAFVERNAAVVRRYIETAPSDLQQQFRRHYSSPLRFGLIIPVLGKRHDLQARSEVDPYLSRIAKQRVRASPICYVKSVAGAYYRMATFGTNRTTQDGKRLKAFVATHPLVEVAQFPVLPRDQRMARLVASEVRDEPSGLNSERMRLDLQGKVPAQLVFPARILYGSAALIGFFALAALALRRRSVRRIRTMLAGAAAMGAAFHGTLAITAIAELGLSRYVVPLWPIVCVLIATAVLAQMNRSVAAIRSPSLKQLCGKDAPLEWGDGACATILHTE